MGNWVSRIFIILFAYSLGSGGECIMFHYNATENSSIYTQCIYQPGS